MQIVRGPDDEDQTIKMGFLKMISQAKESIYIQTPYFIPDESLHEMLKIAVLSGVKVKIMIPSKPDHPFVYRATEYFCQRHRRVRCGSLYVPEWFPAFKGDGGR